MKKITMIFAACCAVLVCAACSAPKASDQSLFTWGISVTKTEQKDALRTVGNVTQYDGAIDEIPYENFPAEGSVYLLLELNITKNKTGGDAFAWTNFCVRDEKGNQYPRVENDSFLSNHNYSRMPGTDLKLGESTGWVCIELPAAAAASQLSVVYSSAEGENIVPIEK